MIVFDNLALEWVFFIKLEFVYVAVELGSLCDDILLFAKQIDSLLYFDGVLCTSQLLR